MPREVFLPTHPPRQRAEGEHEVIQGKNSQKASGVEILEGLAKRNVLGPEKDGGDQKPAQDEEELHPRASKWQRHVVFDGDEVGKEHSAHGDGPKSIELWHVGQLGVHEPRERGR